MKTQSLTTTRTPKNSPPAKANIFSAILRGIFKTGFFNRGIFKKSPWDDFEEENIFTKKRKDQFNFRDLQFNFNKNIFVLVFVLLALWWLGNGIYKVQEGEQGAVLRFGRFDRIGTPGLNYHLPWPFESVLIERVNKSRRIEIGYRSTGVSRKGGSVSTQDVSNESNMLTGDENIVELNVDVMWSISNLHDYLFNVIDPQDTVKASAESAIRDVIGNTPIASVLSNRKQEISENIEKLIQEILDTYKTGVQIEQVQLLKAEPPKEVIQAYRDVQIARSDKEREINQAQAYSNDIIPRARGEAAKILQEAEGYKAEVIARAEGDAARFDFVYKQYISERDVTRSRLYIETVEHVLERTNKVVVGGDGMLPHMAISKNGILEK